jgi:hypothetical protein
MHDPRRPLDECDGVGAVVRFDHVRLQHNDCYSGLNHSPTALTYVEAWMKFHVLDGAEAGSLLLDPRLDRQSISHCIKPSQASSAPDHVFPTWAAPPCANLPDQHALG